MGKERKRCGWLVQAAFLFLFGSGCNQWKRDVHLREEAQAALRSANAADASELFYKAYEANPRGPNAARNLYDYARTEDLELGRSEFAIEVYLRFIAAFPQSPQAPEALERLAKLYSEELDSHQKAIDTLTRIVDEYPGFERVEQARLEIGREYERIGNREQAAMKYGQFTNDYSHSPLLPRAYFLLASIQSLKGEYPEAIASFEAAEAALTARSGQPSPETPDFLDLLRIEKARAQETIGRNEEALETYRSVSRSYPSARIIESRIEALEQKLKKAK